MAIILNIDTAIEASSVCLSKNGEMIQARVQRDRKEHAAWLHPAIKEIINASGLKIGAIEAIGVTIGPGSYTGLRIGLATAKGLCYALNIPLISINTLAVMAYPEKNSKADLLCPMIDARRKEVFTAVYDKDLKEIVKPCSMIINEQSFSDLLSSNKITFSGNGSYKFRQMIDHPNAVFSDNVTTATDMSYLSEQYFHRKEFSDIAYTEPLYLKEFYSVSR